MKALQNTDILTDLMGTKCCQHFLYLSTTWILSVVQADELVDKVRLAFRLIHVVLFRLYSSNLFVILVQICVHMMTNFDGEIL